MSRVRWFWSDAEKCDLRRRYPTTATEVLAKRFGCPVDQVHAMARRLGLKKSPKFLAKHCRRLDGSLGHEYRYPKGHVPANKGLRRPGFAPGRMRETQFKKGEQRNSNWTPIGTEAVDRDGYRKRKVRDDAAPNMSRFNWKYVHVLLWEEQHGPVPPGHCLVFRNGNKVDIRVDNLELITRAERMRRNTIHRYSPELKEVIRLNAKLKRTIRNRRDEKQD